MYIQCITTKISEYNGLNKQIIFVQSVYTKYGMPYKKVNISYHTIIRSMIVVWYVLSYFLHTCIHIIPEYVPTSYLATYVVTYVMYLLSYLHTYLM